MPDRPVILSEARFFRLVGKGKYVLKAIAIKLERGVEESYPEGTVILPFGSRSSTSTKHSSCLAALM